MKVPKFIFGVDSVLQSVGYRPHFHFAVPYRIRDPRSKTGLELNARKNSRKPPQTGMKMFSKVLSQLEPTPNDKTWFKVMDPPDHNLWFQTGYESQGLSVQLFPRL